MTDTGCDISKEEESRLFRKFTQISTDPSRTRLGIGLGLFISKQLCRRRNGEIRVFSKVGIGSCFTFYLPTTALRNESEHNVDLSTLKLQFGQKNIKAMVVDDAPFNHLILSNFFDKLGIKIIDIASDGLEAYKKFCERVKTGEQPDIITMDLDMSVMDGKQSSRIIRQFERQKRINSCFLMIISGNCSESEINECLDQEGSITANSFLKKPVDIGEFARVLSEHFLNE